MCDIVCLNKLVSKQKTHESVYPTISMVSSFEFLNQHEAYDTHITWLYIKCSQVYT